MSPGSAEQSIGTLVRMLATRDGGRWSIAVMHNMDLPSPEMAEAQQKVQQSLR